MTSTRRSMVVRNRPSPSGPKLGRNSVPKTSLKKQLSLPGVAGRALWVHSHQERIAVTICIRSKDPLGVARSFALMPHLLTAATPEPSLPLFQ
jgi:hypothetical protein